MSISRVSTYQLNKAFSNQLGNTQSKFNQLAQQIATGVKVSSVSDDPIAAGGIIKANKELGDIETYLANLKSSDIELSQVDSTLKSINDQLGKAHDVAMQVANGTMGDDELKAYQAELDSIIDNVKRLANTNYNGQYLFSGTRTTTIPFQEGEDGLTYKGNDESRSALVGENKTQQINFIGKDLFGEAVYTTNDKDEKSFNPEESSGIFGALYQLKEAIKDSEKIDTKAITEAMGGIDTGVDTITGAKARTGAIGESFEDMKSAYENDIQNLTQLRSNLQDTDLPTAISDWYSVYQSMQASYSMMSQTMNVSLLNFI